MAIGVVDYLRKGGKDSSFGARKKLAEQYGISGYRGSAVQNGQLLRMLQNGGVPNNANIGNPISSGSAENGIRNNMANAVTQRMSGANIEKGAATHITSSTRSYTEPVEPYQSSSRVNRYRFMLDNAEADKPDPYHNQYAGRIENILNGILGRESFDINKDKNYSALYDSMKERYLAAGDKAMRDTVANLSGLTGGYGNSYAQTVGSQAYDNYLQNLNSKNLDLMNMAYGMYRDDVNNDYNKLNSLTGLEQSDYRKYRDKVSDYHTDRDYLAGRYNSEHGADYGAYKDRLAQRNYERDFEYKKQQDELAQRNYEDEKAYNREQDRLKMDMAMARGSGSGGRSGGGGGRGRSGRGSTKTQKTGNYGYHPYTAKIFLDLKNGKINNTQAYDRLYEGYRKGLIPESEWDDVLKYTGVSEERYFIDSDIENKMKGQRSLYSYSRPKIGKDDSIGRLLDFGRENLNANRNGTKNTSANKKKGKF